MTTPPPDPDAELRRPLSPREADVAALLGRGLTYQRVACNLGISVRRIEDCVAAIATKLPDSDEDDDVSPAMRVRLWAGQRVWWHRTHAPAPDGRRASA